MKKIYLSILSLSFGLAANAQTLTETNHSPLAGDLYSYWQCDSTAINAGASGSGATWNFGTITTHSSIAKSYSVVANTTAGYPIPGIAVESSINDVSYYKSSSTNLNYWGGNVTVGGLAATLTYTAPATAAVYPMSLNTSSSAVTGGNISIPSLSQNGTFTGNSVTMADGTGTLITPTGTYNNGVRIITTQTINFTASLGTGTVTQKNYDYYEAGVRNSLFTISISTVVIVSPLGSSTTTQTIVSRNSANTVGIKQNKQSLNDLLVFPNPSNAIVNFTTENTEAKQVLMYDVTGKLVEKQNLTEGKLKLNVLDYNSGLYIYSVIGWNNQTLKTGKITISH